VNEIFDGRLSPDEWHSTLWSKRRLFVHPWLVRFFDRVPGIPDGIT
jgi:hypothetical protein